MSKRTVFSFSCFPREPVTTVGELLNTFELIADQTPPYLFEEDWIRHRDLVQRLKEFSCPCYSVDISGRHIQAEDFPVAHLGLLLREWVGSTLFIKDAHPLAATFAADTAQVIFAHAFGETRSVAAENFEIEALVADGPQQDEPISRRLKKVISEREVSGMHVVAELPSGTKALIQGSQVTLDTRTVCFQAERCHLSSSFYEHSLLHFDQSKELGFDLSHDFEFPGKFLVHTDEAHDTWDWSKSRPSFAPPGSQTGRWVAS